MDDNYEESIKKDLKAYEKLERINGSSEFNDFFELQVTTVVSKMLAAFTGNGPKDWAEFCRLRGEVIGMLYPIQQIRGAKFLKAKLKEQLDQIYNTPT